MEGEVVRPFDPSILLPGDCLLYRPASFFGWLIALKSWTKVSHVELYEGAGLSVASRDGVGVGRYPLRTKGLAYVRRPTQRLDLVTASKWFETVKGEKYGWSILLCFLLATERGRKDQMVCSQFATRYYRKAGFDPVAPEIDADHVAPSEFLQSVGLATVWSDGKPAD